MLVVRFFRYVHKKVHMLLLFRVIVYSCKKDVRKLDCQKLDVSKIKNKISGPRNNSMIFVVGVGLDSFTLETLYLNLSLGMLF